MKKSLQNISQIKKIKRPAIHLRGRAPESSCRFDKKNDPVGFGGDASRGAALGRICLTPATYAGKLFLRKIRINNGYDSNGTYFGVGQPLYWCANEDCTVDFMLRANSREEARKEVLELYPDAKIIRSKGQNKVDVLEHVSWFTRIKRFFIGK